MYKDIKRYLPRRGYTSVSELIRNLVRREMYPEITENGFTREFEERVLKASAEPIEDDIVWDGKGSFTDFVLKHGKKRYVKS